VPRRFKGSGLLHLEQLRHDPTKHPAPCGYISDMCIRVAIASTGDHPPISDWRVRSPLHRNSAANSAVAQDQRRRYTSRVRRVRRLRAYAGIREGSAGGILADLAELPKQMSFRP